LARYLLGVTRSVCRTDFDDLCGSDSIKRLLLVGSLLPSVNLKRFKAEFSSSPY
jgi:hypothetical protein